MTKIIGVDCDEVLSETVRELLKTPFFVQKNLQREEVSSYNFWEITQLGISREEAHLVFVDFFASEHYWNIQPVQ
jgi:5'(3')-deoxyribonucleotidase